MPPLSSEDRRKLLAIARQAIRDAVAHETSSSSVSDRHSGRLAEPRGAFVTLHLHRRLRGCVGRVETDDSLAETVAHCAVSAALHDPRFAAVGEAEVRALEIEISVLSLLRPISADAVEVGRHGLLVIYRDNRGLLLPQVASERQWSTSRFLAETCRKAGLDAEAWRNPEAQLFGFTVEVFSESALSADYSSST